jgi:hypothetical protein
MKVAIFHRGVLIVGGMFLESGISLTTKQLEKIKQRGIGCFIWKIPIARSDGNVNQYVDTIIETGRLGEPLQSPTSSPSSKRKQL